MDKLSAVLNIHPSRVRVVGVCEGSTLLNMFVDEDPDIEDKETSLRDTKALLEQSVSNGELYWDGIQIEEFSVQESFVQIEEQELEEQDYVQEDTEIIVLDNEIEEGGVDQQIYWWLSIGFGALMVVLIVLLCVRRRIRHKKHFRIKPKIPPINLVVMPETG